MSRSNYTEEWDPSINLWRANVVRTVKGKRGRAFLEELAAEMDAMEVKELITHELINESGACCTIGVVMKARGISPEGIDETDPEAVGKTVGISRVLAAEIEYMNDEYGWHNETPANRFIRMRQWVEEALKDPNTTY